jgi:hypothetical protein
MLTEKDYEVLIEAVDEWTKADMHIGFFGDLLGAMLCGDRPELKAKMEADRAKEKAEREGKRNAKNNYAIVLKAKLLRMRDAQFVNSALTF